MDAFELVIYICVLTLALLSGIHLITKGPCSAIQIIIRRFYDYISFTVARPSVTVKADGALPSGITVLTGQSGSGKSTFIKCIAGLVKPTTGSIQCDETTWVDRDKKLWVPAQERQVGYMPQGNIVFPPSIGRT